MLEIGVHHRHKGRGGRQHAFDAGPGQTPAPYPAQAPHAVIILRDILDRLGGAIWRIVIDEDRFPGNAGKRGIQPPYQFGDIAPFLIGGDDDGKLGAVHDPGPAQTKPR